MSTPLVYRWTHDALKEQRYDLFVASLGFEQRARHIAEEYSPMANSRIALAFGDRHELSYADNKEFFTDAAYDIWMCDDASIRHDLVSAMKDRRNTTSSSMAVCIDISSMSRIRLAACILALQELASEVTTVTADFVYSIAKYSPAPNFDVEPVHTGPVLPEFAGWTNAPEKPLCLVLGLGYEVDRALGAFDLLEPSDVWTFIPRGVSPEYDEALKGANAGLFRLVSGDARKIYYSIDTPFDCFVKMESFMHGASLVSRPVIVPFGPKIFALVSLLVGCVYKNVAVWRISFGLNEPPIERVPNGMLTGLRVTFTGE